MQVSSRQIGACSPTSLLAELQSVAQLKALLLPGASSRYSSDTSIGPQGEWLVEALRSLRTLLYLDPQLTVFATLGGEPWRAPLEGIAALLVDAQLGNLAVGRVVGDRLEERIGSLLRDGIPLCHTSSGDALTELANPIVSAQVALGAAPYVHAVAEGCRFVLGGVASPGALAMAPLFEQLTVDRSDWDRMATATVHAAIVERFSFDLEVADNGELRLWPRGDATSAADIEQKIRRGLEDMGAIGGIAHFSLPDVLIDWRHMNFKWQHHGEFTVAGITGTPPATELSLELVYVLGVETQMIASVQGVDAPALASSLGAQVSRRFPLTSNPFVKSGAWTYLEQRGAEDPGNVRLVIHLHAGEAPKIAEVYREIYEFVEAQPKVKMESPLLPTVSTHYEQWPTMVPRDAIEWDVEIRTARDWL
jgi:hypothetical protein